MAAFTVEITGAYRDQLARELQDSLTAHHGHVQIDAETERDQGSGQNHVKMHAKTEAIFIQCLAARTR